MHRSRGHRSVGLVVLALLAGSLARAGLAAPAVSAPAARPAEADKAPPYVPGQLLVAFQPDATAFRRGQLHSLNSVVLLNHHKQLNIDLVQSNRGESTETLAERYRHDPTVRFVEPNYTFRLAETLPSDTYFLNTQWPLRNTGQTSGTFDADIDAGEAWDTRHDCSTVVVAVADTGVNWNHTDLSPNIWANNDDCIGQNDDDDGNGYDDDCRGWDFSEDPVPDNNPMDVRGHGTHVAGIIGAKGNNSKGVSGICWDVKIMPLKVYGAGLSESDWLIDAFTYAADNDADVINFSSAGESNSNMVNLAIRYAKDAGVLFVTAAGAPLSGVADNVDLDHWYPCYADHFVSPPTYDFRDLTNIVCVTSSDDDDIREPAANYGALSVDLFAPGVSVRSTGLSPASECGSSPLTEADGSKYTLCTGTSMATPHVAGAAALLKAQRLSATYFNLKASIMNSVDTKPQFDGLALTEGRLNLAGALALIADTTPPAAPGSYSATALTTSTVYAQWSASSGIHHYELWRKDPSPTGPSKLIVSLSPATLNYTDSGLAADRAYLYTVYAVDAAGNRTGSADIATTRIVPVVAAGSLVTTAELTNLRLAINRVRTLAGLSVVTFTDQPLTVGTQVKAVHISQPRTVFDEARTTLGLSPGSYTDYPDLTGVPVKAQHLNEVRSLLQ